MSSIPVNESSLLAGSVEGDVPCRGCGYNLRGLSTDGRCPECGNAVGVSMRGDLLRFSDPRFLITLRKGVRYVLWSILIIFIVVLAQIVLQATTGGRFASVLLLAGLLGNIISVIGAWLLTAPDPSGVGEDKYGASRQFIRITLAIGLLQGVINFFTATAGPFPPGVRIFLQTVDTLAGLIDLAGVVAQLNYLSKLALRLPDPVLSRSANQIMKGMGITQGLLLLVGLIAFVPGIAATKPTVLMTVGCVSGIIGLALLIYSIRYIFMLVKFGKAFDESAAMARTNWLDPQTPPPATPGDTGMNGGSVG